MMLKNLLKFVIGLSVIIGPPIFAFLRTNVALFKHKENIPNTILPTLRRSHPTMLASSDISLICSQIPSNPSLQPLHYIQFPVLVEGIFDALKDATIPSNVNTALAMGIAEAFAGVVGGLASRGVADVIGDKKRDTAILKGAFTGAFFGTRSVVAAIARVIGLPRPIAVVLASVLGSAVSEFTKVIGRIISEHRYSYIGGHFNLSSFNSIETVAYQLKSETLAFPELAGDVSKWLFFDAALDPQYISTTTHNNILLQLIYLFTVGATAAMVGNAVKDFSTSSKNSSSSIDYSNYGKAALEGGTLFSIYQVMSNRLQTIVPANFGGQEFLFEKFLNDIESTVVSSIVR